MGHLLAGQGIDLEFGLAPDNLHRRFQPLPVHRSAQDVVPRNHLAQRLDKGQQTFAVGKGEVHVHHIGIALGGTHMVIEDALLQRCQRVDVLNVGHATRHGLDQLIDRLLVEGDQGEHIGSDSRAAGRNTIGRHFRGTAFAGEGRVLLDQRDQRRLVLAQLVHQAIGTQCQAVALYHQLSVLDRQVDIVGLQCRQEFIDAHRIISMLSVIAA